MLKRAILLSALLFAMPAMANTTAQEKPISLSELFGNYHLTFLAMTSIEKDKKYDNEVFKECMAKPHPEITAIYQSHFDSPEHRGLYSQLGEALHQEDQTGMGTAMALMFTMTLSSIVSSDGAEKYTPIGEKLMLLSAKRMSECEIISDNH